MPPQRRQSFAPSATTSKSRQGLGRKRAQSLVPGDSRRLAPRKSILKSTAFTFSVLPDQEQQAQQDALQRQQSSQKIAFAEMVNNDDDDDDDIEGEGIDEGNDYRAEMSGNTSRKSLGRRVSFAPFAQYRVFDTSDQNTNSSGAPSSSPTSVSPFEPGSEPSPPPSSPYVPRLSNENDYPGRRMSVASARRISTVSGYGETSMSLDDDDDISEPPTDPVFFPASEGYGKNASVSPEGEFDEDEDEDDDDDDMEITEAIALHINRKRSLSIAQQHAMARRSSLLPRRHSSVKFFDPPPRQSDGEFEETEGMGDDDDDDATTASQMIQESDAPMEFTIPLEKPLKKPRPPSDAWLALQAATHSQVEGDDDDGEEMELTHAISRLRNARASFEFGGQRRAGDDDGSDNAGFEEASFTSTDDSMDANVDMGDRTLNFTSLLGGVRNLEISGDDSEGATGGTNFARELPPAVSTAPLSIQRKETVPTQVAPTKVPSSVFSAPVPLILAASSTQASEESRSPPTITKEPEMVQPTSQLRPPAPSVFAAPVPPSRVPVPSSPSKPMTNSTVASPAKKRPAASQNMFSDIPQPSPAKKRALEGSFVAPLSQSQVLNRQIPDTSMAVPPSGDLIGTSSTSISSAKTSLGMRRPSGYFAQRRSLAPGTVTPLPTSSIANNDAQLDPSSGTSGAGLSRASPRKSQMRRASVAVAPAKGKVQDENVLTLKSLPRIPSVFMSKATSALAPENPPVTVPAVVVTSEENPERDASELVTMDTDDQDQTARWRANIVSEALPHEAEYEFDDGLPSISIEEFFMMTRVKFMDELTIPRRSTIHPSQMRGNRRDSTILPSMAEYVTAMTVDIPQLQLYSWVAKDLQTWIDNSKKIYREAEDEVAKVTPSLFREFSQANEEGRAELLHQLKLIKANKHNAAKEKWYEWKYQWIENLHENANKGFAELEQDRAALSDIISQAQDILPTLRQQHAQILSELEKERIEIEEVEQSDPGYLEELKVTIAEQNQLLEVYRTDFTEGNAKLERLDEKLSELEAQKQENIQAIDDAERKISLNKNSTTNLQRYLTDELESLQVLHSWRIAKVAQQSLELVFDEQFLVSVPCMKFRPISTEISISRINNGEGLNHVRRRPDPFSLISDLVIRRAEMFVRGVSTNSVKTVVETLSDFWTSCTQIRTQLRFLAIKYPLSLSSLSSQQGDEFSGFKAVVSVLLHKQKTKALVAFLFSDEVLGCWPFAIQKLQCEVKIAYGKVDPEEVRGAVMERLSEATVEDNHACLLDACVEAASRYD
ncbi:hypothetical protein EW145_g162 [Phellinidium pouzarii]|uniref:Spc7 kinetochore protein domain-containing protein n=1 Tax=Phellinidium pouzarii TaxID=167371 RepID=A0A4S4LJI5_9AGAM|nr:hypothetical protein EW145_g162 [Phellinidium pouzarii]